MCDVCWTPLSQFGEYHHCAECPTAYDECPNCYSKKKSNGHSHPHSMIETLNKSFQSSLALSFDGGGVRGHISLLIFRV
jgi:hypothetical protein